MKSQLFVFLVLYIGCCWSANILAFLPTAGTHIVTFLPFLSELANRGHNVTVLSPSPLKNPPQNYHDIDVSSEAEQTNNENSNMLQMAKYFHPLLIPVATLFFGPQVTLQTLNNTKVKDFIHSNDYKFDLVIFENFQHECFVTMGHKFGAHVIQLYPASPIAFSSQYHSQPFNPSYIPDPNSGFTDQMSFFERTTNVLVTLLQLILFPIFYMPKQTEIMNNYFKYAGWESRPSLEEMTKNISLTLMNTHFTIGAVKPLVPNFIEVAGMHFKPAPKLPEDLQDLMDNASDGVVYFSFGSVVKASQIPKDQLEIFLNCLGQIRQKVLWKWDSDDLPQNIPPNVVVKKGFPQDSILEHPNCVLFINHGGIRSTEEAFNYGVPTLCISVFGDQYYNCAMLQLRGLGIHLKYPEVTERVFANALYKMLNNKLYTQNAKALSKRYNDRPLKPLDYAVYWIEYVLRHNGAHHLKTGANNLNWFQFLLTDVMLFLFLVLFVILYISFYIMKKLYSYCCKRKELKSNVNDDKKTK